MSDRNGVLNKYRGLVRDLGKAALSSFYPNDIEYYLCAFELVNSDGTESYFVFPIQPSSISKSEPNRTNIKKALSGLTILKNSSFIPQELNLKGNFGRRFKILSNLDGVAFTSPNAVNISKQDGIRFKSPALSGSIKTGYGAIKLLQSILKSSNEVDDKENPKKLFFYNLGFGESYLVSLSPSGMSFSQTEDQNMIWNYNISLSILAPLSDVATDVVQSQNSDILSKGVIRKGVSVVAKDIVSFLKKQV